MVESLCSAICALVMTTQDFTMEPCPKLWTQFAGITWFRIATVAQLTPLCRDDKLRKGGFVPCVIGQLNCFGS